MTVHDAPDSAVFRKPTTQLRDWSSEEVRESIRNRFVTGDWGKSEEGAGSDQDSGDEHDAAIAAMMDGEVYVAGWLHRLPGDEIGSPGGPACQVRRLRGPGNR